jgi:pimeloyl-ACP methyl ester carboxylesterase
MNRLRQARTRVPGAAVVIVVAALGCASPIGVKHVSPREVHHQLTESALSSNRPSAPTRELLTRFGLRATFEDNPKRAIEALRAGLSRESDSDRLFALAELSFLVAEAKESRRHALAASLYAYAFLFESDVNLFDDALDPRVQIARNLYNRGLRYGLASRDFDRIEVDTRLLALPFGVLDMQLEAGGRDWAGWQLREFAPAADLEVRGLANRYRHSGVGAPLAASIAKPKDGVLPPSAGRVAPGLKIPVTAFLRFDDLRAQLLTDYVTARLEIYAEDTRSKLEVEGVVVPLELEKSSSLALTLDNSAIWDFAFAGFRLGDYLPGAGPDRLMFLHPYRPGRIPLVLVHGTFSSPATWAEMVNELENDPIVASHYQIWLFIYNTGSPISYSGGILVDALVDTVASLDPQGQDAALRRMVVVGHSQGGLLTKLTAIDSGNAFWKNVSQKPFESLDFDDEARELLARSLFYQPLPFVERVVFMSTPHHGSYLATWAPATWVSRLVKAPITLTKLGFNAVTEGEEGLILNRVRNPPTSLDNMRPSSPFLETLSALPIAPRIHANSIIAVDGDGLPQEGSDGVVQYTSAHLVGVESELIVQPSGHSVHMQPAAIQEVRRILIEHVAARTAGTP